MVAYASSMGSYIYCVCGTEDHIHFLLTLSRTVSISNLIEEIKKQTSKWIKTKDKDLYDFGWQRGYAAFSVSESQVPLVMKYIENQKQHHQIFSFQDEYRKLCLLRKVKINENYAWD